MNGYQRVALVMAETFLVAASLMGCTVAPSNSSSSGAGGGSSGAGGSSSADGGGGSSSGDAAVCTDNTTCTLATCCGGQCVDLATAPTHCGDCTTECPSNQLCQASACHDATLASTCAAASALLLLDGKEGDEAAVQGVGNSLMAACSPFALASGAILDPAYVSASSHFPVAGPQRMVVTMGGPVVNAVVNAYETMRIAPLFFDLRAETGHRVIRDAAMQEVVLDALDGDITPLHDWFLVETFRDSVDGRLVLMGYGLGTLGTVAAGFYAQHALIPTLGVQTRAWWVVEWTGTVSGMVTAQDTFTQVAVAP